NAGAVVTDLAPLTDASYVMDAIAAALGVPDVTRDQSRLEQVTRALQDCHLLLLLDNFEHVLDAAPQVAAVLASCPRVKALVTSRAALHLRWEHELPVPPLELPGLNAVATKEARLAVIAASPAVQLFEERSRAVRPDFALTPEAAAAVAEICVRLDGLPLAIELAAARVKILTPSDILARIEHRFDLLVAGPHDLPDRQRSLRTAVQWSHGLLGERARTLFRRLAVFVGGFTLDAVEAVCTATRSGTHEVLDALTNLVDHSLVVREPAGSAGAWGIPGPRSRAEDRLSGRSPDAPRYRLLETLRQYALEQLTAAEEDALCARHRVFYLTLAERAAAEILRPDGHGWLAVLEAERDNLRQALAWSLSAGPPEHALRLATALLRYWGVRGHLTEGRRWFDAALAAAPSAPVELRAPALRSAGHLARLNGDYAQASRLMRESLALFRALGDTASVAGALNNLGMLATDMGDYERAERYLEESLRTVRRGDDRRMLAAVLGNLANVALARGDYPRAAAFAAESGRIFAEIGLHQGVGTELINLGHVERHQGKERRAAELYHAGIIRLLDYGDRQYPIAGARGIAALALTKGLHYQAALLLGWAAALRDETGFLLSASDQAEHDRIDADIRAALGDARHARATAAGRLMDETALLPCVARVVAAFAVVPDAQRGGEDAPRQHAAAVRSARPDHLTSREVEVLRLLPAGLTNNDIADRLVLSAGTVQRHLANIYVKIGAHGRAQAAAYAVSHGLTAADVLPPPVPQPRPIRRKHT
ncbi:MAG: ATP-binding protein, partial [Dehalococcoidia bacterium]